MAGNVRVPVPIHIEISKRSIHMYASGRSNTSCILSLSTQCCVPCLQISGGWDLALCVWDLSTGRYIHYVNSIGHVCTI